VEAENARYTDRPEARSKGGDAQIPIARGKGGDAQIYGGLGGKQSRRHGGGRMQTRGGPACEPGYTLEVP